MHEEEFAELIKQYGPFLRYIISSILSNASDAEECFSEVSAKLWEKRDGFNAEKGTIKSWLSAIARNTAINFRRDKERKSTSELTDDVPSQEMSPEEHVLAEEKRQELARALRELSAFDRALVYRKYYYRQSMAQIAAELSMTERAVEGRLYRLKQKLRRLMGGDAHG